MKSKFFRRKTPGEYVLYSFVFVIFALFAASYLYIFVWGTLAGFKTHDEIVLYPFALPTVWHFENYIEVFSRLKISGYGFFGMLGNSLYFSVLGSLIGGMVTCMLAYVTSKFRFFGRKFYFYAVIVMITLPIYGNGGSMYKVLYKLGLINSYAQIVLAFGGMSMNYLIYYSAFQSLSDTFREAAYIDGANEYTVFFRVMFPLVINIFGALFLIAWVADWNNYSNALIYLNKLPVLASGIYSFELNMRYEARLDILYAAYMISAIPPLLLFTFFNGALTSNVSLGGIKE
jgi:ABC transporter, permease protein